MRKILVALGGGPTAVINQSLVGVVLKARLLGTVYGARFGIRGILNEEFLDLSGVPTQELEFVAVTPGSALGSTRDKPDIKYCMEIFKVLQAHQIEQSLLVVGLRLHLWIRQIMLNLLCLQ